MHRIKIVGLVAVLALVAAACGGDGDETGTTGTTGTTSATGATATGEPLAEFGETTAADPALVERALGPVEPSDEASWNIILASIARAEQSLDEATIAKAMECWNSQECDTGTGGDIRMGDADGAGGPGEAWA